MAQFKIKTRKDTIEVTVSVPEINTRTKEGRMSVETIRPSDVYRHLRTLKVKVGSPCEMPLPTITNVNGPAQSAVWIFHRTDKKSLTPEDKPVIIEEKLKKRKRVKRDSETGNKTTS